MEAEILQQHDLSALEGACLCLGVFADDVPGKDDLPAQKLAQTLGNGRKAQLFLPLALGLAEVGAGDHRRALIEQIPDGGQRRDDALVRGDLAGLLVLRNVEVAAQQDLPALDIHVVNGFFIVVHNSSPQKVIVI